MAVPRPLSRDERAVLDALLTDDVPGVAALRTQARTVLAGAGCGCGCGSVDLLVQPGLAPAPPGVPGPVSASVVAADGAVIGGVDLFLHEGRLSLLEVSTWLDDPLPMPSVDRLVR